MTNLNILGMYIAKALLLCIITSCNNPNKEVSSSSARDSLNLDADAYPRLLQTYKNEQLTNDTILLGFRIGMPQSEVESHLNMLISDGKVVPKNGLLYAYIPANMICTSDKDGLHQFIAELYLHLNETSKTLVSINAVLYGPRFFIKHSTQESENKFENSPLFTIYKESYEKSGGTNFDSFYNASKEVRNKPEEKVSAIKGILFKELQDIYNAKYGMPNHILTSKWDQVTRLWFSQGRVIELTLTTDYKEVAEQYLNRVNPVSKDSLSELVNIGKLNYSSVVEEINFQESINQRMKEYGNVIDSTFSQHDDRDELTRKHANASGI